MVLNYLVVECGESRARLFPAVGKKAKIPSYNNPNSEKNPSTKLISE